MRGCHSEKGCYLQGKGVVIYRGYADDDRTRNDGAALPCRPPARRPVLLQVTDEHLYGRNQELRALHWSEGDTRVARVSRLEG